jgi:hypothetical protein
LSEYLAHVHDEPFDSILFKSVQREGGTNVVLFPERGRDASAGGSTFPLTYVHKSFKLFSTKKIQYAHEERYLFEYKGQVTLAHEDDDGLWLK